MVRTSTDAQSTEDQKKELIAFCKQEGYDDIVCVEKQGASAAKEDDEYRAMIDEVKHTIETDPDIKCFAVWHLNRLARTEEAWIDIKSFFVKRRIQIICKNPYLKLLAPGGDIDQGMELAMGLMAILSKQDQAERKAKFKRAKSAMKTKGQYTGGHTIKYGYRVEDKYFIVDEEHSAPVVRAIFNMYSSGKWSTYTLSKELNDMGVDINQNILSKILCCPSYYGAEIDGRKYPPIITKELYDKCESIRNNNKIDMRRGERLVLGAKLIKCCKCGATCTSNSRHYVCCQTVPKKCDNHLALKQSVADALLWRVAEQQHLQYVMDLTERQVEQMKVDILKLQMKIDTEDARIKDLNNKKDRIVDTFIEGLIDKKTRDLRLKKVEDDISARLLSKASLQEKREAIARMLDNARTDMESGVEAGLDIIDTIASQQEKYDVIHQHIKSLVPKPVSYGVRDPRSKKPNGVEITITAVTGQRFKYLYIPRLYKGRNLYVWNGRRWVADSIE